jgi:PAS domain-containing protein
MRMAEQALRASEIQYRRLFEAARDGILSLDAETGDITAANSRGASSLGVGATRN